MAPTLNEVMDELKAIRLEMKSHAKEKGLEELKGLITAQATTISNLQEKVGNLEEEVKILKADVDEKDQYSRRTSLRLNGIQRTDGETAEKCCEKVIKMIKKLKLPTLKFTSFRSRTIFYKSRKEVKDKENFGVSLVLTKTRLDILTQVR